jgi:hypothetical protein
MILTSLLDNKQYFWIKVPRTATISYKNFFLKYYQSDDITCEHHDPAKGKLHMHHKYTELCQLYNTKLPGVTVVRHPLTRFVSGLHMIKLLTSETECPHDKRTFANLDSSFLDNTSTMIDYFKTFFGKNCQVTATFQDMFLSEEEKFIKSFFEPQMAYVYNPNVTWFKYENIQEFNTWISTTLGYDTTEIKRDNESRKHLLAHLDFSNPEFIKHVELMFYDDYKVFNYPFQYLT